MKLTFVNHASVIIEHAGVRLITDPWLEGKVFNNGWDLISPTKLGYDDFRDIRYIWFSHEHPDHFSPPVIKKIPPEHRANITVLFQHTIDGRVAEFCRKAGFRDIIELYPGKWQELGPGFTMLCEHFEEGDSWSCFRCGDITVLNTNDCALSKATETDHIRRLAGKPDVLLTQFSYAYWAGNKEDIERRKKVAADKLDLLKFQCDQFMPRVVIPFASFVYFCHEENFYLNDSINTIERALEFIKEATSAEPVVLYNGDTYEPGKPWDSGPAMERHMADLERIRKGNVELVRNNPVQPEPLEKEAAEFIQKLKARYNFLLIRLLRPAFVFLWDHHTVYRFSIVGGLQKSHVSPHSCDVAMSSGSFLFCLRNPYGLDTTQVNGRLQKPVGGNYSRFYNYFRFEQQASRGIRIGPGYVAGAALRKIAHRLGWR